MLVFTPETLFPDLGPLYGLLYIIILRQGNDIRMTAEKCRAIE
jgi:hypothetical protein